MREVFFFLFIMDAYEQALREEWRVVCATNPHWGQSPWCAVCKAYRVDCECAFQAWKLNVKERAFPDGYKCKNCGIPHSAHIRCETIARSVRARCTDDLHGAEISEGNAKARECSKCHSSHEPQDSCGGYMERAPRQTTPKNYYAELRGIYSESLEARLKKAVQTLDHLFRLNAGGVCAEFTITAKQLGKMGDVQMKDVVSVFMSEHPELKDCCVFNAQRGELAVNLLK